MSGAIRNATSADYATISASIDDWWGGRNMRDKLPRLFFDHFSTTSFIYEVDGRIIGFLVGFPSQAKTDEAYIHFIGVHPDHRGQHIAQQLYERFYTEIRQLGKTVVTCITSPVNRGSIAFHTRIGFQVTPGDSTIDGVPVTTDYDGPGEHRVTFRKRI